MMRRPVIDLRHFFSRLNSIQRSLACSSLFRGTELPCRYFRNQISVGRVQGSSWATIDCNRLATVWPLCSRGGRDLSSRPGFTLGAQKPFTLLFLSRGRRRVPELTIVSSFGYLQHSVPQLRSLKRSEAVAYQTSLVSFAAGCNFLLALVD